MSLDRGQPKRGSLQRRSHGPKAPRVLTSGVARRLRAARPDQEAYVVTSPPAAGPPSSVPPALGQAALRALGNEQPREVRPEDVYRLMTPSPESTGWGKELTEDRENYVADDPWEVP